VKNLAAARKLLQRVPGVSLSDASGRGWSSVFLPPALTHGLWLELREVR